MGYSFENTLNNFVKAAQASAEKVVAGNLDDAEASTILGRRIKKS